MIKKLITKDWTYEVGKERISKIQFYKNEADGLHVYKVMDVDNTILELVTVHKDEYTTTREEVKPSGQLELF